MRALKNDPSSLILLALGVGQRFLDLFVHFIGDLVVYLGGLASRQTGVPPFGQQRHEFLVVWCSLVQLENQVGPLCGQLFDALRCTPCGNLGRAAFARSSLGIRDAFELLDNLFRRTIRSDRRPPAPTNPPSTSAASKYLAALSIEWPFLRRMFVPR